ncbi:MAG: hypothetical protein P4L76_08355 [Beijerinckiaceae bacterium]|nr:hypothetical protein [Beijerinckiaceae bacterium]
MARFVSRPLAFALLAAAVLIGGAQAFPSPGARPSKSWTAPFKTYGFGAIDPGECTPVRQQVIDHAYRVHTRVIQLCN